MDAIEKSLLFKNKVNAQLVLQRVNESTSFLSFIESAQKVEEVVEAINLLDRNVKSIKEDNKSIKKDIILRALCELDITSKRNGFEEDRYHDSDNPQMVRNGKKIWGLGSQGTIVVDQDNDNNATHFSLNSRWTASLMDLQRNHNLWKKKIFPSYFDPCLY